MNSTGRRQEAFALAQAGFYFCRDIQVVEERTGPERRQTDRRSSVDRRGGLERRRGPGRRRSDLRRQAEEGEMGGELLEFVMAIDEYKRMNSRPFPSWSEVFEVIQYLGYRKVAAKGEHIDRPAGGETDFDEDTELADEV